MIDNVNALTQAAESISNFGVLAVIAAMYLLLSGAMLLACFKWFKNIINSIIEKNEHMMNQLVKETQDREYEEEPARLELLGAVRQIRLRVLASEMEKLASASMDADEKKRRYLELWERQEALKKEMTQENVK